MPGIYILQIPPHRWILVSYLRLWEAPFIHFAESNILRLFFQALPMTLIPTSHSFIKHIVRNRNRNRRTIYACVGHSVFGAVLQGAQQSCRHITDVLAFTGCNEDDEVDHHTPRGEACDFNSHLAWIDQVLHLLRQRLVDLPPPQIIRILTDELIKLINSLKWICLQYVKHMYLLYKARREVFVELAAGVLQISSEVDVGKSCCGIKSLSIYKEKSLILYNNNIFSKIKW